MFYFYKYLTKWGEEDGFPLLDKDLFFYLEVQKFKVRPYKCGGKRIGFLISTRPHDLSP
jgi:hypothetical protein